MSKTTTLPRDIRLEVRVKNNLILTKMEEAGIVSLIELARQSAVQKNHLYALVNMRTLPINKMGRWRPIVLQLAEFFGCLPEDLFSEAQLERVTLKRYAHVEMSFARAQALFAAEESLALDPAVLVEAAEARAAVDKCLDILTPREQLVLRSLNGIGCPEQERSHIGKQLDVGAERVRQIGDKAINKLRHDRRTRKLLETIHLD